MHTHHPTVVAQLASDRATAFTRQAAVRTIRRRQADRRPPPGRRWLDRRDASPRRLRQVRIAR